MVLVIGRGGCRQAVPKNHPAGVLRLQQQEYLLGGQGQVNHPLAFARLFQFAFDGVTEFTGIPVQILPKHLRAGFLVIHNNDTKNNVSMSQIAIFFPGDTASTSELSGKYNQKCPQSGYPDRPLCTRPEHNAANLRLGGREKCTRNKRIEFSFLGILLE